MNDQITDPLRRREAMFASARAIFLAVAAGLWTALGTFWTIYAWIYQEVIVPSTAPVNLTTEVTVAEVGTGRKPPGANEERLQAILVQVTAVNVSTKTIYLLSNYWDSWAGSVRPRPSESGQSAWLHDVNLAQNIQTNTGQLRYATSGRHYEMQDFQRVAWGNLFPERYALHPKETITASTIFYVPNGSYDMVHVEVHIPTTELTNVEIRFAVDAQRVRPRYFRLNGLQDHKEVTDDPTAVKALKVQETLAFRQMSLWNARGDGGGGSER